MVNFVKPNLLGQPREFTNRFANPITHGQHRDSSPMDIRTMRQKSHVLYTLLKDTVQVGFELGVSWDRLGWAEQFFQPLQVLIMSVMVVYGMNLCT
jgi:hypothetical protein